jgi:DNA-binding transcriptional LysR family regulator
MATRAGAGVCVMHCFIADQFRGGGADDLVPVLHDEVGLTRTFWLLTHPDTRELARIRVAADFIVEAAHRARGALLAG